MCQRAIKRTAQLWCFTQAAGPPTLPQPLLYLRTLQFYQYFIFQIFLDDNGHWITVKTIEVANNGNQENIIPNVESERSKLPICKQRKAPKREAPSDAFSREAEATLDFIEDRKKNEAVKDDLTIASLKAAIRHHESAVRANELKAAWYCAKLQREGFEVPLSKENQDLSSD